MLSILIKSESHQLISVVLSARQRRVRASVSACVGQRCRRRESGIRTRKARTEIGHSRRGSALIRISQINSKHSLRTHVIFI